MASNTKVPGKVILKLKVPKKVTKKAAKKIPKKISKKVAKKVTSAREHVEREYISIRDLNEDGDGVVELCVSRTAVRRAARSKSALLSDALQGSVRVVKHYNPDSERDSDHLREIDVLRHIPEHPYIQNLLEFDEKNSLWLMMPFYIGGCLKEFGRILNEQMPTSFLWHVILQTLEGLQHLHGNGFTHGGISSRNIMVDPAEREYKDYPNIVLCDFEHGNLESETPAADYKSTQTLDIIHLGNEWHDLAHDFYPSVEDFNDVGRYIDGSCDCEDIGVGNTPFGRDDDLFNKLLFSTSKIEIDDNGTTCATVNRDFYGDMLNRRQLNYAPMPLIGELWFRIHMTNDKEIEDAVKKEHIDKNTATAAT